MMKRRTFFKLCGVAAHGLAFGFGTTGCTIPPKDINWSEVPNKEFLKTFDDWFVTHKLYNGLNPNLQSGHIGFSPTFKGSTFSGYTPGMDYASNNMYAAADGIVYEVTELNTGRLGGKMLDILHGMEDRWENGILTRYAHLSKLHVNKGDKVKRGDLVAQVGDYTHAKLMMTVETSYVDPDNYGENHSYMKYLDGNSVEPTYSLKKYKKQRNINREFCSYILPQTQISLMSLTRIHVKKPFCLSEWDNIEIFRYVDEMHKVRPELFPKLSKDKYSEIKVEFYANQPIILTLPLKA
jgi:hypothetical protein